MKFILTAFLLLMTLGCKDNGGQQVIPTAEEDEARLGRIQQMYKKGDLQTAVRELNLYLTDYPKDDLAWTILGHAHTQLKKDADALQAYDQAMSLNPNRVEALTGKGILHRRKGNYNKAMAAYQRAVELDPGYAQAYSSMVTIALKQNRDELALKYAQTAYELDSKDPVIVSNLALAYHYNNDMTNRDRLTKIAEGLGYDVSKLQRYYSGEFTIRD